MQIVDFIREITVLPGVSGFEEPVARRVMEAFGASCDQVSLDDMMNVHATMGVGVPHMAVYAHTDEVALVVSDIEDGFLRMERVAGVDPRILPGHIVRILTPDGELPGVVGFKPPHLTPPEEAEKAVQLKDLYVDTGFDAEDVVNRVRVGDMVLLAGEAIDLAHGHIAGKTMDDRSLVAVMVRSAELLRERRSFPKVTFISSSQEEVGHRGARTSTFKVNPDLAVVLDVTHAKQPGAKPPRVCPIDKLALSVGPAFHPGLVQRAKEALKRLRLPYTLEAAAGHTGTDTDHVRISREGVPCMLISVPVKYMHTSVEMLDVATLDAIAEFLCEFALSLSDWEELLCY